MPYERTKINQASTMGASISPSSSAEEAAAATNSDAILVAKFQSVRAIIANNLGPTTPYSYEEFCSDLDVEDVYTRRLLELLVRETANKARRRASATSQHSFEYAPPGSSSNASSSASSSLSTGQQTGYAHKFGDTFTFGSSGRSSSSNNNQNNDNGWISTAPRERDLVTARRESQWSNDSLHELEGVEWDSSKSHPPPSSH